MHCLIQRRVNRHPDQIQWPSKQGSIPSLNNAKQHWETKPSSILNGVCRWRLLTFPMFKQHMEFGHYFRIQLVINAERRPSRTEQGGYKDLLNTSMGSLMILVCTEEYLDWHGCQCLNKHWIQRLSKTRMESLMVLDLTSIGYKPCSLDIWSCIFLAK